MAEEREFPLYLMRERSSREESWSYKFLPLREAGVLFDSGFVDVEIAGFVLIDECFNIRTITAEEEDKIQRIADEYSASK